MDSSPVSPILTHSCPYSRRDLQACGVRPVLGRKGAGQVRGSPGPQLYGESKESRRARAMVSGPHASGIQTPCRVC